ncbi:hypothetical protein FB45DRAFT_865258 [Roridomyces roridus]|uniref:Uncharacterized protein n=1 Tax=Roridomyces roridus TaxID=1738132 RepID=A0AAD7BYT5_9AGAR|nr:hypothetical protein FB45DRAFT_865258 [Roridomyces roridus]
MCGGYDGAEVLTAAAELSYISYRIAAFLELDILNAPTLCQPPLPPMKDETDNTCAWHVHGGHYSSPSPPADHLHKQAEAAEVQLPSTEPGSPSPSHRLKYSTSEYMVQHHARSRFLACMDPVRRRRYC